ncbi:MAG: aconitate hydratase, partial [Planctomycetales bacterium]|nr:aconitate hydratase [Planctomycetales bacterium]
MAKTDPFAARDTFDTGAGPAAIYRLSKLEEAGLTVVNDLPFSIRVLLESCLRNCDGFVVEEKDVQNLANWTASRGVLAPGDAGVEIPFKPARVVL